MTTRTVSAGDRRIFARNYPGERRQPRMVRAELAALLEGCPHAEDAILIASELAANAAVHSNSAARGGQFTVRVEVYREDYIWIEVEDQGGPKIRRKADDGYPHGLDLVEAFAGTGNWGIDADPANGTIIWARLDWPGRLERIERVRAGNVVAGVDLVISCLTAWPAKFGVRAYSYAGHPNRTRQCEVSGPFTS